MGTSKNNGTPKSSILIGFSIINHPFSGTPIFGNTHMFPYLTLQRPDSMKFLSSFFAMLLNCPLQDMSTAPTNLCQLSMFPNLTPTKQHQKTQKMRVLRCTSGWFCVGGGQPGPPPEYKCPYKRPLISHPPAHSWIKMEPHPLWFHSSITRQIYRRFFILAPLSLPP